MESDERIAQLRRERESLLASTEGIQSNFEALKEVENALYVKCQTLDTQANRLIQERSRLELILAKVKRETAEVRAKAAEVKAKLDQETRTRGEIVEKLKRYLTEIVARRNALKKDRVLTLASDSSLAKRTSSLALFERQLRRYAAQLNDRKRKIEISAKGIVQDIGTSKALHPTLDYLRLVNEELEGLELRLKISLPSSFERQHLENCMTTLQEKKAFLERLSHQTERTLQDYTQKVHSMYESVLLRQTPPIPPPPKGE